MKRLKPKYITKNKYDRLYGLDIPIIALTGGIATGKSTVSNLMKERGLKLIDADQLVKSIYKTDEAKSFIKTNFPDVWINHEINFPKLRELFFHNKEVKETIERFIYTRLPKAFLEESQEISEQNFYIYDVPLLFERHLNTSVDLSVVVYAPQKVQSARLMARDGHVEEMAKNILGHQMDIEEKKVKADFVIDNSRTLVELGAEVDQFLHQILE